MPRPRSTEPRKNMVANVRLTDKEREGMEEEAADLGHGSRLERRVHPVPAQSLA